MVAPKLRFQEFDGDWESKKLKDLTDILKCGVASTPKYVTEGGYPFLSAQNISRNGEMNYSKVNNISDDFYKKISKTKLLKGDILYSRVGASYGVAAIFDREEEYGVYVSLTHIRVNDTLNNIFLKQFLNSPKARIQAEQGVFQGGGVQNLNVGVVEEFNLTLPSKQEQTKIASFLSTVDEKISQLSQKHQLLSQYKQGMMQKILSQQIRFKADDGSEFEEWESRTLAEVGENIIGLTYSPTDVTNDGSGILVLRSSNIKNGRLNKNDQVRVNKKIKDKILVQPNDILICTRNGSQRLIGKSVIINDNEVMTFGAFMSVYRSQYNRFIAYLMQTPWFFEQVQMNLGARINQITTGTLNEFTFDFPCLEEQTKIANFLSAIDQKIEVIEQQIEQAKQWKKGLLQQMFV